MLPSKKIVFTAILVAADMLPAFLQGELIGALQNSELTSDYKMKFSLMVLVFYLIVIVLF